MAANDRVLYRKKGAGWGGWGSCAASTNFGTTSYPSGIRKGDMIVLNVVWRPNSIGSTVIFQTPAGFTSPTEATFVAGVGSSNAWRTGTVSEKICYRISDGTESGNISLFWNGTVADASANIYIYSKPPDSDWETPIFSRTYDVTPAASWSTTLYVPSETLTVSKKDMIIAFTAVNAYDHSTTSDWYNHRVVGAANPWMFGYGVEIEDSPNGSCYGHRMVVSNNSTYYSTTTDSFTYLMTQNTPTWNGSTYPAGFTILMLLKFTSWPSIFKTYYGGGWKRGVIKHWFGGSWTTIDNGVSSGKIMKRWNGSSWIKVSGLYLSPSTQTYNITYAAQTLTPTIYSGNHFQAVTYDSFVSFDPFEGSGSPNTITRFNGIESMNIHILSNPSGGAARMGTVVLRVDEGYGWWGDYNHIYINQAAGPSEIFILSPDQSNNGYVYENYDSYGMQYNHYECYSFSQWTVTSNIDWYVTSASDFFWGNKYFTSGYDGYAYIYATATSSSRIGYIDSLYFRRTSDGSFLATVGIECVYSCP